MKGRLGGVGSWETEVGDNFPQRTLESEGLMESSSNVCEYLNKYRFYGAKVISNEIYLCCIMYI